MESNREDIQEQLHQIERGETASWVVYPPTPLWWALLFGVWAGVFALTLGFLDDLTQSLVLLALVLVLFVVMAWDRRRRGTYPSGCPPRELHPAIGLLVAGAIIIGVACWLVGTLLDVWLATGLAVVLSTALIAWYERRYAVIAARVRERLG